MASWVHRALITFFFLLPVLCHVLGDASAQEDSARVLDQLRNKVQLRVLPNGMRVIFYHRAVDGQKAVPVFSSVLAVRVGGVDEAIGHTGIAHMLEHMAFKGTPEVGTRDYGREKVLLAELEDIARQFAPDGSIPQEFREKWNVIQSELKGLWVTDGFTREYEKRGATGMNATTGTELTRYYVSMPRSAFEFWCSMESERILHPVMRQFYQERDVVGEERRMRYEDDPGGKLYENLLAAAFRAYPYRNPVIGYEFDLRKLTATMVEDFHSQYYSPDNMVLSLVGDVDADKDIDLIQQYFGRIPASKVKPLRTPVREPPQEGERRFSIDLPSAPLMQVAYHKPAYPNPDDVPISMMAEILAGSKVSPLYVELVKKRQLAISVSYYEAPGQAAPNLLVFSFVPRAPHTSADVLAAFDDVLRGFRAQQVDANLMNVAKRSLAVDYLSELRSSLDFAELLASTELLFGSWTEVLDWYDLAMQVTQSDVQRVASKYLLSRARTIGEIRSVR